MFAFKRIGFQGHLNKVPSRCVLLNKQKAPTKVFKVHFKTSERRSINPLIVLLLKTKAVQAMKLSSMFAGRQFRKVYQTLPENYQARFSRHKIGWTVLFTTTLLVGYYFYIHYEVNKFTGRKRFVTFTEDQIKLLAENDSKNLFAKYDGKFLHHTSKIYKECEKIIVNVVSSNGDISQIKDTDWKLFVIDEPTLANAFVLPNGEIYVFTGILKVLNNWAELSVVIGHEMSHSLMGHAKEQQSYIHFGQILVIPLLSFIWFMCEDIVAFVAYQLQNFIYPYIFDVGFNLPYNRQLEEEADKVGIELSTKACYDPRWSVLLWQKLALKEIVENNELNEDIAQYFSTHPSSASRSIALENLMPKMLDLRKKCNCPNLNGVDPLIIAQTLRKCCAVKKEEKNLLSQIEEDKLALSQEIPKKKRQQIMENIYQKQKEAASLNKQFDSLLLAVNFDDKVDVNQNTKVSFWRKVLTDIAVNKTLTGTIIDQEIPSITTANTDCLHGRK